MHVYAENLKLKERKLKNAVETPADRVRQKSFVREYSEAIIIAVLLALFIRAFVVQAFKIPSGSMEPTLLVGDHILVNKFIYGIRLPIVNKEIIPIKSPKQFDVVVFQYPNDRSKDFIKRVIGLPLQKVQIINKKIYIDDVPLNDPYGYYDDAHIIAGARGQFRAGPGASSQLVRHGRQSGPQPRQPLLGLRRSGRSCRRSFYHLLVLATGRQFLHRAQRELHPLEQVR